MSSELFTFELVDKLKPEAVIRKCLEQISDETRGYVVGKIEAYTGPIVSYTKKVGIGAALSSIQSSETVEVNIQDKLGVQDEEQNRYEVYLSVKGLEHYKYRIMFVDYGTVSYPARIVMNEELALEYWGQWKTSFDIHSMDSLEEMMEKILHCGTMIRLLQSLINEALRKEVADAEFMREKN
ncbi:MAG: hypothetical protein IJA54_05840 [Tyzzerella sp.]|nr:hypothetical protein [Tyzzerella sp.]